ncbi:DB module family protein [Brugia pahangi]
MDNTHITLRVRNGIKKLPYSSKNNADDKRNWQLITNEFGKSVGQLAEWLRRWTANLLSFPTKYYNQSVRAAYAPHIYISPATAIVPFYDNGAGKINETNIPWKGVVQLPKMRVEHRTKEFRISDNSNEIALAPVINSLNSPQLSPYQQQRRQNIYHYKKHFYTPNIPASISSSRKQEYDTVRQPLYYNPWDPFGLLNNPFWKSIFPNLFAPQPQLFISTTTQSARSLDLEQGLTLVPTKSPLSPNQKLTLCCKKQNLSPSCQLLCNYDTFTDRSLVTAVISNQCPGYELEKAFNCATSRADHSACCIRNGIKEYRNGHCMVFCTTHLGNPHNTLQYIDCLQVFDRIKNCYRDYHVANPNIHDL